MLTGCCNTERIWNYLKAQGLNDYGIAGLMGNMSAESGLVPNNMQDSYENRPDKTGGISFNDVSYTAAVDKGTYDNFVHDAVGFGICQWTWWSRKEGLLETAQLRKTSIADLETQLVYLMEELTKGYRVLYNMLKSATSIRTASDAVLTQFEKPTDQSEAMKVKRATYGQNIYEAMTATTPAVPTGLKPDSSLVSVVDWTNKNYGKRLEKISKITIHHMAAVTSAASCMKYHRTKAGLSASANYYIGKDGEIGQAVPEDHAAWTSSSQWNDQRAITIEVSNSRSGDPWPISDKVYDSLIKLCADICKRNGIKAVNYTGGKDGILTEHKMFCSTACPGPTIHGYLTSGKIVGDINAKLGSTSPAKPGKTYTVQRGDTLWSIAAKQLGKGSRWTEIARFNGITDKSIEVGQVLKLPD